MISLRSSIHVLPGAGPARAAALEAVGVSTLQDLLLLLPKGHRRRAGVVRIADLSSVVAASRRCPGSTSACEESAGTPLPRKTPAIAVDGVVRSYRSGRRRGSPSRLVVADASGEIEALLFSLRKVPRSLAHGKRVFLEGSVAEHDGKPQLVVRHYEAEDERRDGLSLVPEYDLPKNVPPRLHARWIASLVPALATSIPDWREGGEGAGLLPLGAAVALAHRPASERDVAAASRRLGYEELAAILRPLLERRRALATVAKPHGPLALGGQDRDHLVSRLPFALTGEQRRAFDAICDDLGSPAPMHRLLHGEVGSGKTAVALLALLAVAQAGWQCALLAPTAILAAQHAKVAEPLFLAAGVQVFQLTRQTRAAERRAILERLRAGVPALVIGTVRLFSALESMPRLALAVVDEQQRFGVSQRARMRGRGKVDLLVMTATPIPRSLALVLYGDLDLTVIRELPPGRGGVATSVHDGRDLLGVLREVTSEAERGGRVFVVCPQIGSVRFLEQVTGTSLADLVDDRVAGPLGLDDTAISDGTMAEDHRHGIFDLEGSVVDTSMYPFTAYLTWHAATFNGVSSVPDLLDLLDAWQSGALFRTDRTPGPDRFSPERATSAVDPGSYEGLGVPFNGYCPCTPSGAGHDVTTIGRTPGTHVLGVDMHAIRYADGITVVVHFNSGSATDRAQTHAIADAIHTAALKHA